MQATLEGASLFDVLLPRCSKSMGTSDSASLCQGVEIRISAIHFIFPPHILWNFFVFEVFLVNINQAEGWDKTGCVFFCPYWKLCLPTNICMEVTVWVWKHVCDTLTLLLYRAQTHSKKRNGRATHYLKVTLWRPLIGTKQHLVFKNKDGCRFNASKRFWLTWMALDMCTKTQSSSSKNTRRLSLTCMVLTHTYKNTDSPLLNEPELLN